MSWTDSTIHSLGKTGTIAHTPARSLASNRLIGAGEAPNRAGSGPWRLTPHRNLSRHFRAGPSNDPPENPTLPFRQVWKNAQKNRACQAGLSRKSEPLGMPGTPRGWAYSLTSQPTNRPNLRFCLGTNRVGNVRELRAGLRANRANGRQADDDNQGQHDRVFDRGGAIFRSEETLQLLGKVV